MPNRLTPEPEFSPAPHKSPGSESDLGELAALFAAYSGGSFSPEVAAELALDIVLNEVVEQACLTTGATGAAIILQRDGEMVCRASSGANAPQYGARLGSESGLTAECIRTRQVQRCNDAQTDPRADMEASRILGIRSVIILPLLCGDELAGVFEVFWAGPGAFGERDEITLQALAQRIVKNLERAGEALVASLVASREAAAEPVAEPGPTLGGVESMDAPSTLEPPVASDELPAQLEPSAIGEEAGAAESVGPVPRAGFDVVRFALTTAVVVCAVLLATLVGLRIGSQKAGVRAKVTRPAVGGTTHETNVGPSPSETESAVAPVSDKKDQVKPDTVAVHAKESSPPAGSLVVYENGKEVFRMMPGGDPNVKGKSGIERASVVEANGIVELSPEAAEGSVLHRVEPEYPEEARQQRIQGAVVLDVRIGRDGTVQDVKVVSGEPPLRDAAIAAVKQWRFKPQVRAGWPVEMQTRVTFNFRAPS